MVIDEGNPGEAKGEKTFTDCSRYGGTALHHGGESRGFVTFSQQNMGIPGLISASFGWSVRAMT
ncbi:MAG: hypothetical protein OHK0012_24780 [Synechococcales cyanobacterium]